MTRVFRGGTREQHLLATKGAPEAVIDLCHLAAPGTAAIFSRVEAMAERGLRVLGVARGEWQGGTWPQSQHDFAFRFLGLVGFADPPRPEVPAAIAECRSAGVRIIMLTGDYPATARAIAREVGLSERAEVITGPEMAELDDGTLRLRLRRVDLCARLKPEQKLRIDAFSARPSPRPPDSVPRAWRRTVRHRRAGPGRSRRRRRRTAPCRC